jgi:hypothetical protein
MTSHLWPDRAAGPRHANTFFVPSAPADTLESSAAEAL